MMDGKCWPRVVGTALPSDWERKFRKELLLSRKDGGRGGVEGSVIVGGLVDSRD
jgi:hypothetical protein